MIQQKISLITIEVKTAWRTFVKKHATEIINYEKKEMIPLSSEENKSYFQQEFCHICKKEFITNIDNSNEMFIKYCRVRDNCYYIGKYRGAAHNICNLRYKTPKKFL